MRPTEQHLQGFFCKLDTPNLQKAIPQVPFEASEANMAVFQGLFGSTRLQVQVVRAHHPLPMRLSTTLQPACAQQKCPTMRQGSTCNHLHKPAE